MAGCAGGDRKDSRGSLSLQQTQWRAVVECELGCMALALVRQQAEVVVIEACGCGVQQRIRAMVKGAASRANNDE